jgi:hypothetical protein
MPLIKGHGQRAFEANVRELVRANSGKKKKRPMKQILAIAYSEKRKK